MIPRALLTALLLCAVPAGAQAQTVPGEAPPGDRVCLALSGGGAVGIAHIGILRGLEKLHVPVGCVAGTSMGAIVGGLYAAGYSPDELETIIQEIDWSALLRDQPDRRDLPFRRKVDDLTYLTRWELGLSRQGLKTPTALVAGHRLGAVLRLLALRANGVDDFDRLPLPFRALATDARTGEAVVLHQGPLGTALRASMAIPGLFSPVELEGRVLVDGGLVDNLPVGTARSLGAATVIAVDLEKPLASREAPASLAGILSSLSVLSRREVERSLADADFVLRPEVEELGLLDFQNAKVLIERGEQVVAAQAESLRRLAVDEDTWSRHLAAQRRRTPVIQIGSVTINPGPGLASKTVVRSVRTRAGQTLDPKVLEADLDHLWELGDFETVDFDLAPSPDGTWDLRITARNKSWGPSFLRFGMALASDLEGTSSFNVLTDLTMTRLNRLGAEIKVAAQGGENTILRAELYQPLSVSGGGPFVAVGAALGPTKQQVLVGTESLQYRFFERAATLDLGLSFGRYGEVRVGLAHDDVRGRPTERNSRAAPHFDRTDIGYRANLIFDQLDRVNFPRRGVLAVAEIYESSPSLGADDDYQRASLQAVVATTRGRNSLVGLFRGTSALGGELPVPNRVRLGGLFNLSGLPPGELSGSYGGVATLLYLYRLGGVPKFADGIYAGFSLEAGNAWERAADFDGGDLKKAFAIILGIDTPVGPVYAAHGRTSGGKDSLYLYVGRSF